MPALRVGIIGTGGMGKAHAHCFMRNSFCKVVAAAGHTQQNLKRFVTGKWTQVAYDEPLGSFSPLYSIPKAYTDWQSLVQDGEIELVAITSPNALHFKQAKMALQHGKHVLVEKPLCVTTQEAKELVALAQKAKRTACVAQCWRFHPEVEAAKMILGRGEIGKVVKVKSYGIHRLWGPSGWFRNPKLAGGGALLDMGVHGIDTVRYLLNEPKARRVSAHLGSAFAPKRKSKGALFIDDLGILLILLDNNIPCVVESGWNHPYAEGGEATTVVLGKRGYVRIFPFEAGRVVNGKIKLITTKKNLEITAEELYQREVNHVVNVVRGRQKNTKIPLSIALESMRIMEAAYTASQQGKTIALNKR